jgi:hypothetical protein
MRSYLSLSLSACVLVAYVGVSRGDEAADAKAVIDKALKASGGEAKLSKIKAMMMKSKGTYYGMGDGLEYTAVSYWQAPDKEREEISFEADGKKMTLIFVFDGEKGWESIGGETKERDKSAVAEAKESMYIHHLGMLYPLEDKAFKLTPLGEIKVGDKAAVGVKVGHKDHRDVNLLFDKKTNLLLKIETQVKDPKTDKEVTQEMVFDDYKEVDGIPLAKKVVITRDGKKFVEAETTETKIVDKHDAKLFEKP